jgi:hypothetical protein
MVATSKSTPLRPVWQNASRPRPAVAPGAKARVGGSRRRRGQRPVRLGEVQAAALVPAVVALERQRRPVVRADHAVHALASK